MQDFTPTEEDRIRIDIPDEDDPDHEVHHGRHGRVIMIFSDDAATVTADQCDNDIYRVEFDDGSRADFRHHDLRPPIK